MSNISINDEYFDRVTRGVREGVRKALLRHKLLGQSIVIERDGEIVVLQPDEIPVASEEHTKLLRD